MKYQKLLLAMLASSLWLSGCGGDMLGSSDADDHKLIPEVVDEDPNPQRPTAGLNVLKAQNDQLLFGQTPLLLRGANLAYADAPLVMYPGIKAIREAGSNVVRVLVKPTSTANDLEAALTSAALNNLFVIVVLDDDALFCKDDEVAFTDAVRNIWLKKFLPVLHQDRFQENLMINLARGWGPQDVFNGYSTGYRTYIDSYKSAIRVFRQAGFEVPIVVDAPCGEDFYAFDSNRGRELYLNDPKKNIVISVNAYGRYWNSPEKVEAALNLLAAQKIPYILTEFGGSGVGERPVDHKYILARAADNYAYEIDVPWKTSSDAVGLNIPLSEITDVSGKEISFDIKFPEAYVNDGNLGFQVFLLDENDNYANIGWNGVWQQTPNEFNSIKKIISNDGSFGWKSDDFDKTRVAKIGIEIKAQGKAPEISGPIVFDNFKIVEGDAAQELFNKAFTESIAGWATGWNGTTVTHRPGEGVALLKGDGDQISALFSGIVGVDFTQPVKITANIFFPEGFAGSWVYGKFFNNTQLNDDDTCCAWLPTSDIGSINFGEWNEVILTADFGEKGVGISTLGIQLGNLGVGDNADPTFNGEIIIRDLIISGVAAAATEQGEIYRQSFDETTDNWVSYSWGDMANVTAQNGSLTILPSGDAWRIDVQHNNPAKIEGLNFADPFRVKTRIFIPAFYESVETFVVQFYLQDGNWSNHFNAIDLAHADIAFGEWNELDIAVEFPEGFDRVAAPKHMGFSFATDFDKVGPVMSTTEAILIDEVVFEGLVAIPKEEVVIDVIDFHYEKHFTDFTVSPNHTEGLTADDLAGAATLSLRSRGFSWLASTWFGGAGNQAGLDLVTVIEDAEALTERGADIVYGKGGIAELREPE